MYGKLGISNSVDEEEGKCRSTEDYNVRGHIEGETRKTLAAGNGTSFRVKGHKMLGSLKDGEKEVHLREGAARNTVRGTKKGDWEERKRNGHRKEKTSVIKKKAMRTGERSNKLRTAKGWK